MTLEKHVTDTMKEWQIKIGNLGSELRLYYPKSSLCGYLNQSVDVEDETLRRYTEEYLRKQAVYLGAVSVSVDKERFCVCVGKQGCDYIEKNIPTPEFLSALLSTLESQKPERIISCFEEYARNHGTVVKQEKDGESNIFYFENENIEPYVYCIDQNEFGITYHRFTREDYSDLSRRSAHS